MPEPTRDADRLAASRLRTWRGIQAAAVRLVAERGFAAVTVDDVAAAAGTSRRTFFNYFPTKVAALFDPDPEMAGRLRELVDRSPRTDDPWADLCWICRGFAAAGSHEGLALRRRLLGEFPEFGEYVGSAHGFVERALAAWAQRRLPDDPLHARLLTGAAGAALSAAFRTWQPEQPTEEYVRLLDRALAALRVAPPEADQR
ncbi:TetR family transcriptional regulator [Trujillonella endophytica]|uniref:Transcriptional regulator, TetR family n=1 Tax=Trujillonella endophytica TaxID=673521 RepID=A0A1H8W6N9_9ACTN|nr:TetR family transcriptional regulator [Trujillella endophytica]SEP23324.1 transcriptional regulator, TetR family [Trujillella endophytica]